MVTLEWGIWERAGLPTNIEAAISNGLLQDSHFMDNPFIRAPEIGMITVYILF